jgi:hypothetical protein
MNSEDEFNQFVLDEVINSSSSDDELYDVATLKMTIKDEGNHPGHIGSIEGHEIVQCDRLLYHDLLYENYFSNNPTFNAKTFRQMFAFILSFLSNFHCTCTIICYIFIAS